MMLTNDFIKAKAREYGADLCGIGDISLYEGTDPQRDPRFILPKARCVIGFAFRVPRALYDCAAQQRQFFGFTSLGVKYLDEELAEIFLLKMGGVIEDAGYDACLQRNVSNLRIKGDHSTNPEVQGTYELVYAEAVAPGKPVPDVIMDFTQSAVICGLGSPSLRGTIITPRFGPYVRLAFIVTDAPLEPDPPFTNSLCDHCGECAAACPGRAIAPAGGLDTWQCSVYYRGAHRSNPFQSADFLQDEPEREAILNGTRRFDSESARAIYKKLDFLPGKPTGYVPCLCGKKCDVACYEHLKRSGRI